MELDIGLVERLALVLLLVLLLADRGLLLRLVLLEALPLRLPLVLIETGLILPDGFGLGVVHWTVNAKLPENAPKP